MENRQKLAAVCAVLCVTALASCGNSNQSPTAWMTNGTGNQILPPPADHASDSPEVNTKLSDEDAVLVKKAREFYLAGDGTGAENIWKELRKKYPHRTFGKPLRKPAWTGSGGIAPKE